MDKSTLKSATNFLQELFFPSFCYGCKKEGSYLCQDCWSLLDISEYNYCLCTKDPLRLPPQSKLGTCSRCARKKLSGIYSAVPYKERFLIQTLIHHFKYEPYVKSLAPTLAAIIKDHLSRAHNTASDIWSNSVWIPVPLDRYKIKERGYNQSVELAKELGKLLQLPVAENMLFKIRETKPQVGLSADERAENIHDAFAIKNPAEIAEKKIFLVDDVYTTGSTMEECARILKDAGASKVWGITIAREA